MVQGLIFLHLSDIHFSKRSSSTYDPDLDLRKRLVEDAVSVVKKTTFCSGILVSGDIAFGGKEDEYKTAGAWLREICKQLDCSEEVVSLDCAGKPRHRQGCHQEKRHHPG